MTLKFLADENIASSLIKEIQKRNYDIKDLKKEKLIGLSDNKIIDIACKEHRVILTHDKDFANLFTFSKKQNKGVVLLRFLDQSSSNVIKHFIPLLNSNIMDKFDNSLVVVSENYIKIIKNQ